MSTTSHFVDGKSTLTQQQDTLNFMEHLTISKVITYSESTQKSSGPKANEAILTPVDPGHQPKPLTLVAVAATDDVAKVISDQVAQGQSVVFHEKCWVKNEETTVVGLRKTS